jgi:hypothetical protein
VQRVASADKQTMEIKMSDASDLALRPVQILFSIPILAAFVIGGLPILLPMLVCRFAADRPTAPTT